jgi:lactoylglutathione lyase
LQLQAKPASRQPAAVHHGFMKFAYTILYVADVPRAVAFYEAAFGLSRSFISEAGDYGELATGGTRLAFAARSLMASLGKKPVAADPHAPSCEIALTCDDVPAALAQALAAGATLVREPAQMAWGQTIAYVADGDGFLVEICTPMG